MDIWVVAAAAGAGYVAKFLHKSKEKEGLVESVLEQSDSRPFFEQIHDSSCPIRRLGRRGLSGEDGKEEGMPCFPGETFLGGSVDSEVASTSGFDDGMVVSCGSNEDYNVLSLSGLSPRFRTRNSNQESEEEKRFRRGKKGLRRKRFFGGNAVKPLSSLDSCLIAQLYNEHVEMEEYVFSAFPSPSTSTARPLLVTDGSRIISRASSYSCTLHSKLYKDGFDIDRKNIVVGVPPLPDVKALQLPKKLNQKKGKGINGRMSSSNTKVSGKQGLPERMFIFYLGITFGIISTAITNKREVDKLNELLKQTENLVQDLHEELDMKDLVTVKVLTHENYELQENSGHYVAEQDLSSFSPAREINGSDEYDIARLEDKKSGAKSESMSIIEAELEAELERLELNINASCSGKRLSGLVELDPDSLADIVQGELRVDMVSDRAGNQIDSDRDRSVSTTRKENVNYAVSPRELSLRLHEVIQSRLEERVLELERALQISQKKLHLMESKQINIWRNYSNSEIGSSSQDSPTMREECNTMAQPLFLNLSDDALDEYNEAYEALNARVIGIDEGSPPFVSYKGNQFKEELSLPDRSIMCNRNRCEENVSGSNEVVEIQYESDYEDDDDSGGDEMAKLLIKQIVAKARQGSPVVLSVQRMLNSMDENYSAS